MCLFYSVFHTLFKVLKTRLFALSVIPWFEEVVFDFVININLYEPFMGFTLWLLIITYLTTYLLI